MDEGTGSDGVPDLKDIEVKIGRKTPEGLLRWMREEASNGRADAKPVAPLDGGKETGKKSLDEKIRKLKAEMVRVLQFTLVRLSLCVCLCVRMCACARACVCAPGATGSWTCGCPGCRSQCFQ